MGMVMGVTAVIVGMAAAICGLVVWTALIFPQRVAGARATLEEHSGRCFLTGLVLTMLLGVPGLALLHAPNGMAKLAGWALALPLLSVLVLGLTAMAQLLGGRLRQLSPVVSPLGALVRGAITLELAAILPFLGWFLFTPLVGLTLVGAGALGALRNSDDFLTTETRRHGEELEEKLFTGYTG